MFDLIFNLNEKLEEAIDTRQPMFKAVLVSSNAAPTDGMKVLDVQALPQKNLPLYLMRAMLPIFRKYGKKYDLNFESKEAGLFNTLLVTMVPSEHPDKTIKLELTQLTHEETPEVKRAIYLDTKG